MKSLERKQPPYTEEQLEALREIILIRAKISTPIKKDEEVGFGTLAEPTFDAVHRALRLVLTIATERGPDYAVLDDWEDSFARDNLRDLLAHGDKWNLTPKRAEIIRTITKKLEKEGLLPPEANIDTTKSEKKDGDF